jgi:predicted nucleic acid-binding Zn ribbon protein
MKCPECGTWNPDDRQTCWRCGATLPKPVEKEKRAPTTFLGFPLWVWALILLMVFSMVFIQCQAMFR